MNVYEIGSLSEKLATNSYPGRGIVLGITPDGRKSVAAYFIMGRSVNSRNRIFALEPDGIRTEAHDPSLVRAGKRPCVPVCLRTTALTGLPEFPVYLQVMAAIKCPS